MRSSRNTTRSPRRRSKNNDVEHSRIRRLLASEYTDFSDIILVESPFAETTRNGRGIRQVSLGLTPTKLIIAADFFKGRKYFCPHGIDPSIESFELISVYPLQYVTLSVFNRRRRNALKARFIDGRVQYYELGGIQKRKIFWNKWCEEVENFLAKKRDGSSLSETTAASSSSTTTLYLLSSEIEIQKKLRRKGKKAVCRVWAHYGGAGDYVLPTWPQKDLYLGPGYNDLTSGEYAPVPVRFAGASLDEVNNELKDMSPAKFDRVSFSWPTCSCHDKKNQNGELCDVLFVRDHNRRYCNTKMFYTNCPSCPCQSVIVDDKLEKLNVWYKNEEDEDPSRKNDEEEAKLPKKCLTGRVSRFGFGVSEKCHSNLVLTECYPVRHGARFAQNFCLLMENAVKLWESGGKSRPKCLKRPRHFRRYGLCTAAHFLHSLGPWTVQPGERCTLQGRRSFSLVTIRRQSADTELKLPVSRRQLAASISYTALQSISSYGSIGTTAKGRVVLFWTPEYWYRPRPASAAYRELRQHLNHLKTYRQEKEKPMKRNFFSRRKKCQCEEDSVIVAEEKPSFFERIFSGSGSSKKKKTNDHGNDDTAQLRRLLRMDFRITIWDIDSSTLAAQVTLIDRDLFVRIPAEEIEIVVYQRSSKNAPNLAAWIAFSHRISCLVASEILAIKKLGVRCRIIARLVNAASKCFAMGNFHSCRSILSGLQTPAIYRLRSSWSYLRLHHANRYETMERLCKIYKSSCATLYRRAWARAERSPPAMPFVGDLLIKLLGFNNADRQQVYNVNVPSDKRRIREHDPTETSPSNVTKSSSDLKNNQAMDLKPGIGRRILTMLTRMRNTRYPGTDNMEQFELPWTTREHDLAWKYFYQWRNILSKRSVFAKEQDKLRNMDPRMKRVLEVVSWLSDCQKRARGYDFLGHSFTREFLLKSRYREDRENFFISLKLESSKVT